MESAANKIVFAGGGTGGHLFPALAVAAELRRSMPGATISFIGARRGIERDLVPRSGYPLRTLPLRGLKGSRMPTRVAAVAAAAWGGGRCLLWFVRSRPLLVIGVGGYASGPAILAAKLLGIKTMILEQNHYPGATNRWLASRVDAVCLPSETAREHLGGIGVVTGNPVRPEFFEIPDLGESLSPSLLVCGGSRGARSLNRAMIEAARILAAVDPPLRIVHQTGFEQEAEVREAYRGYPENRSEILPFLEDMPARLAAADLVVCRAGASTLAELTAAGRPAILVPYPHAADDHQRRNAAALQAAGAAVVVADDELDGASLAVLVQELAADAERRQAMGRAARTLARPDATRRVVEVAEALVVGRSRGDARVP